MTKLWNLCFDLYFLENLKYSFDRFYRVVFPSRRLNDNYTKLSHGKWFQTKSNWKIDNRFAQWNKTMDLIFCGIMIASISADRSCKFQRVFSLPWATGKSLISVLSEGFEISGTLVINCCKNLRVDWFSMGETTCFFHFQHTRSIKKVIISLRFCFFFFEGKMGQFVMNERNYDFHKDRKFHQICIGLRTLHCTVQSINLVSNCSEVLHNIVELALAIGVALAFL